MRIGLDLDNTVIDYGSLFHEVGLERGWVPRECGAGRDDVRQFLLGQGREDLWTTLQGTVYGPRLTAAAPYQGVSTFLQRCEREGASVFVLSHKSIHPARGPAYDLRAAATQWFAGSGLVGDGPTGLNGERIVFFDTRVEKVAAIRQYGLHWFVDDLPDVFREPGFPDATRRVLFDPHHVHDACQGWLRADSWPGVEQLVFGP